MDQWKDIVSDLNMMQVSRKQFEENFLKCFRNFIFPPRLNFLLFTLFPVKLDNLSRKQRHSIKSRCSQASFKKNLLYLIFSIFFSMKLFLLFWIVTDFSKKENGTFSRIIFTVLLFLHDFL